MSRQRDLLRLAVEALRDGESPFHESFLIKHEVTLDEVYDLADFMASSIEIVLTMAGEPA
ncbi:MAG: hypothetical protein AAGA99_21250 [Actinomycetota bacterium]